MQALEDKILTCLINIGQVMDLNVDNTYLGNSHTRMVSANLSTLAKIHAKLEDSDDALWWYSNEIHFEYEYTGYRDLQELKEYYLLRKDGPEFKDTITGDFLHFEDIHEVRTFEYALAGCETMEEFMGLGQSLGLNIYTWCDIVRNLVFHNGLLFEQDRNLYQEDVLAAVVIYLCLAKGIISSVQPFYNTNVTKLYFGLPGVLCTIYKHRLQYLRDPAIYDPVWSGPLKDFEELELKVDNIDKERLLRAGYRYIHVNRKD